MSEFSSMKHSEAKSDSEKYLEIISGNFLKRDDLNEKISKKIERLKKFNFDKALDGLKELRLDRIRFRENLLLKLPELEKK